VKRTVFAGVVAAILATACSADSAITSTAKASTTGTTLGERAVTTSSVGSSTTGTNLSQRAGFPVTFVGETLTLSIGEVVYWLGDDEEGCTSIVVLADDEYFVPQTTCAPFGEWKGKEDCAHRAAPSATPSDVLPTCEVPIPLVAYGRLPFGSPNLACFVAISEGSLGPATFEPLSKQGLYLMAAPAPWYGVFSYGADGRRYSDHGSAKDPFIFSLCEEAGPWNSSPKERTLVLTFIGVDLAESWLTDGARFTLWLEQANGSTSSRGGTADVLNQKEPFGVGGYVEEGLRVRIGITQPGSLTLQYELTVPAVPEALARDNTGEAVLDFVVGPGVGEPARPDPSTIKLVWRSAG